MKKINLTLFIITLFTISLNAQMRVHTNGNVSIQNESTSIESKLVIGNGTIGEEKVALVASDKYMGALFIGTGGYNVWTYGIRAIANPTYNMHVGVEGWARLENASNQCRAIGVRGTAGNATNGYNWGVYGLLSGINEGTAIYGTSDPSDWGQPIRGRYAGYFRGNVSVEGNLTATTITTPSDIAYKTNIISLSNNSAISKIQLMNPVIYNLKQPELPQTISESESDTISTTPKLIDENSQEYQKTHYGLIAQELQEVFPELVYENSNGLLNVNYIEIIPILIEAIKEQQEEIENLKDIINSKKIKKNIQINNNLYNNENDNNNENETIAYLNQNIPNPFTENTLISFFLPKNITKAKLIIYDLNGKELYSENIEERGYVEFSLTKGSLSEGMYLYSLIAENKIIATKRMILTK